MSHLMSLSGVKRTCPFALQMSAFDPKRTFTAASLPYYFARWLLPLGPIFLLARVPKILPACGPRGGRTQENSQRLKAMESGHAFQQRGVARPVCVFGRSSARRHAPIVRAADLRHAWLTERDDDNPRKSIAAATTIVRRQDRA